MLFFTLAVDFALTIYLQWRWKSFIMDFKKTQQGLVMQDWSSCYWVIWGRRIRNSRTTWAPCEFKLPGSQGEFKFSLDNLTWHYLNFLKSKAQVYWRGCSAVVQRLPTRSEASASIPSTTDYKKWKCPCLFPKIFMSPLYNLWLKDNVYRKPVWPEKKGHGITETQRKNKERKSKMRGCSLVLLHLRTGGFTCWLS